MSDVRRAANLQPAVIFEMAYQFLHAHTTLLAESCKGNTVGHTAILPAADRTRGQDCARKWPFAPYGLRACCAQGWEAGRLGGGKAWRLEGSNRAEVRKRFQCVFDLMRTIG